MNSQLYYNSNDLYMATAGSKHPELLGQPCSVGWRELWSELIPIVDNAMEGETMSFTDHFLAMERHGYTEETACINDLS